MPDPKPCSLHHFRPVMSWTFSHCRSGTISDHYKPEFPDKTLSIDFLSFNILIQNEQLATNKQLKASIKYMYEWTYIPTGRSNIPPLINIPHPRWWPVFLSGRHRRPSSAVGWGETGENCESYLTLCIDFCDWVWILQL